MQFLDDTIEFFKGIARLNPKPLDVGGQDHVTAILENNASGQTFQTHDLEQYQARPRRRKATPLVRTVDSFAAYFALHKVDGETLVAFDPKTLKAVACFDHLPVAAGEDGRKGSWMGHTCTLQINPSEEWRKWQEALGKTLRQETLAELLDDLRYTIVEPDAATLLETVQNLAETRTVKFAAKTSVRDGKIAFSYQEDESPQTHTIKVPESIRIALALTEARREPNAMEVKIRYRWQSDGRPTFTLAIPGLDQILRDEAERIQAALVNALGGDVPVLQGTL